MNRLFAVLLCFGLMGCATTQSNQPTPSLDRLIGHLTYDEAIMKLGKPISVTQGTNVFMAEWNNEYQNTNLGKSFGNALSIMGGGRPVASAVETHVSQLRLSFDKQTNTLVSWLFDPR